MTSLPDTSRHSSRPASRVAADIEQLSFWENSPPPPPKRRKPSSPKKARPVPSDPEISCLVGKEILGGSLDPAFWALALAESDGSRDHAISCYARLRLESLEGETQGRKLKREALEARRRAGFRENPTSAVDSAPPAVAPRPTKYKKIITNHRRSHRLSLFWLLTLALGISGSFSAASRHFQPALPGSMGGLMLSACLSIGPLLAVAFATFHFCAPRTRPVIRHLIPVTTCAAAFASLYFGLLVIKARTEFTHRSTPSPPPVTRAFPFAEQSANLSSIALKEDSEAHN